MISPYVFGVACFCTSPYDQHRVTLLYKIAAASSVVDVVRTVFSHSERHQTLNVVLLVFPLKRQVRALKTVRNKNQIISPGGISDSLHNNLKPAPETSAKISVHCDLSEMSRAVAPPVHKASVWVCLPVALCSCVFPMHHCIFSIMQDEL